MQSAFGVLSQVLLMFYYWIESVFLVFIPDQLKRQKSVKNEVVLITGAGSGLGRLLAVRFARRGAKGLVLWDIAQPGLTETARLVKNANQSAQCATYVVDVTNRELVYQTAERVKNDVGKVTMLINNAGVVSGKRLIETKDEMIRRNVEVNSLAHFWTTKAFLQDMIAANHGHLVTIASAAGLCGFVQLADYCASKFAAVGFEESLRLELKANGYDGIRSTVVCPFFFNTGMFDGVQSPFVPIMSPEYVADQVVFSVLNNQEYVVRPRIVNFLLYLKAIMPTNAFYIMYSLLGGNEAMSTFVGRQQNNHVKNH